MANTITIYNRPIKKGIYAVQSTLSGNLQLPTVKRMVHTTASSIQANGEAMIGLWNGKDPFKGNKDIWFVKPPEEALWDVYGLEFNPGSALANVNKGGVVDQVLYSMVQLRDVPGVPPGWIPVETVINTKGQPIKEISKDGRQMIFTPTTTTKGVSGLWSLSQLIYPAEYNPALNLFGINTEAPYDYGYSDGLGIAPRMYRHRQLFSPLAVPINSGLGIAPLAVAALLAKGALLLGTFLVSYYTTRYLLDKTKVLYFSLIKEIKQIWERAKKAVNYAKNKLQEYGLLVPAIVGVSALVAGYMLLEA